MKHFALVLGTLLFGQANAATFKFTDPVSKTEKIYSIDCYGYSIGINDVLGSDAVRAVLGAFPVPNDVSSKKPALIALCPKSIDIVESNGEQSYYAQVGALIRINSSMAPIFAAQTRRDHEAAKGRVREPGGYEFQSTCVYSGSAFEGFLNAKSLQCKVKEAPVTAAL